ncbi:MAG: hypothetical protein KAR20_13670 [Candidatus Heimdallarchaeota archaeon]|nr:hypothetical protein [Candidatus Heimdallarchaeota archaeon]
MNKIRYFTIIIGVCMLTVSMVNAQDSCPWDQHTYENEREQMPELTEFLSGKRYILPETVNFKDFSMQKYDVNILLKLLQAEKVEIADYSKGLTADEIAFLSWIVDFTQNRKKIEVNRLIPTEIEYDLGNDWRYRGAKSQRPNDKVQVEFKVRKTQVFRTLMGKILGISEDAVILNPANFVLEFFNVIQSIEYADFSKFNEFKAEMFYGFGEMLTIAGLKHNAYRAYLQSAEFTKNDDQHEISIISARSIKQSVRADFDKFEDDFLMKQKEEAQKFNAAFTLFATEHNNFEDLAALKSAFLADYSKSSTNLISLLIGAGVFVLLMLIVFSRKGGG